jgi:hypothetical protein
LIQTKIQTTTAYVLQFPLFAFNRKWSGATFYYRWPIWLLLQKGCAFTLLQVVVTAPSVLLADTMIYPNTARIQALLLQLLVLTLEALICFALYKSFEHDASFAL